MVAIGLPRTTRARITLAVAGTVPLGAFGAALAVEGLLLTMPLPASASGRAWRTFGLTAVSTGVAAGLIGGAIGLFRSVPIGYDALLAAVIGLGGLVSARWSAPWSRSTSTDADGRLT